MATARTAAQDFTGGTGASGGTKAFDTTGGDALLVFAWKQQTPNAADTCTYAGASMTYIGACSETLGLGALAVYLKYSPTSGSNNIVFTPNSGTPYVRMIAIAYSGTINSGTAVDGSTFTPDTISSGTSGSITVTATGCWVVSVGVNRSSMVSAVGTGVLTNISGVTDTDIQLRAFDSNGTVGTGSQSFGYSGGGTLDSYMAAVSIAPTAGVVQQLSLMTTGVGS